MNKVNVSLLALGVSSGFFVAGFGNVEPAPDKLSAAHQAYQQHVRRVKNTRYLTLIDYSKPIFATRLWVIDMTTGKPILSAHVAHAFKSGLIYASHLSNLNGSRQSCAGTFLTQADYNNGRFGRAMRVRGLDPCNDQAIVRAIVFHSTLVPYTAGCFATTASTNAKIISLIKDGSLVYVAR